MAKYIIEMSCGHVVTMQLYGKTSERERKIEYFKREGICTECYKKQMEEINKSKGLVYNASILPYIDNKTGDMLLSVWFDGDTISHKDAIKSLGGYQWGERESAQDFASAKKAPYVLEKVIPINEIEVEVKKALSIGAVSVVREEGIWSTINYQIALNAHNNWLKKQEMINEISKPDTPQLLIGHKWNQKIYGKLGKYSIYLDGDKKEITDEEAEEINKYLSEKEEYMKEIKEIKNA